MNSVELTKSPDSALSVPVASEQPVISNQSTTAEIQMSPELQSSSELQINGLETLALVIIALATLMCLYRLVFGPTNPDRVVSADILSVIATVILCCIAALFQSALYLDVAVIYGVLSFVGMIALARAIEGGRS